MREGRRTTVKACALAYAVLAFLLAIPLYAQPADLSPGNWIEVKSPQVPGLSGRYQVNEDGAIEFPVVGSLAVEGTSLQALKEQLQDKLADKGYQTPVTIELEAVRPSAEAVPTAVVEGARALQIGDILAIEVTGEPTISGHYTVRPTGTIILPMAGEIPVTDLAPEELTGVLIQRLKRYVIDPVVSVNVLSVIPRLVSIVGQVGRPGLYPIDQTPTALALLAAAGGVLPNGELASAVLYRDGQPRKLTPEGLLDGDMLPEDLVLNQGDTLVIPEQTANAVLIVGAVQRPGAVPLQRANNLARTILLAGGPTEAADLTQAYILRGDERIDVNLSGLMGDVPDAEESSLSQIGLQADDVIVVPPGTGRDPVQVIGEVNAPGPKLAMAADTLSKAIMVSGGVTERADLSRTYILRRGQRIEADLDALLEQGDSSADVSLEPGDAVVVPGTVKEVYVAGRVANPGAYPSEQAKTVLSLWSLVGLALPDANLRNCTILRSDQTISVDIEALINQGDMSQNVALQAGDKIIVPEVLERVYILGQVGRPGPYPIKERETLMDMLGKAGGTTVLADIGRIALLRRNLPEAERGGARVLRPETAQQPPEEQMQDQPGPHQPAFGIEKLMKHRRTERQPRLPRPEEEGLGPEQQVSLRILASADWEDITLRPQAGDVIFVPAKEVGLTRSDYLRVLLGIGTALLVY